MKAYKREIVIITIAALATLSAVWFFFGKMKKEKIAVQTDLYSLIAPAPDAILAVNRPASFADLICSNKPASHVFTTKIPAIYLDIIGQHTDLSSLLLSFHPQGIVFYAKATDQQASRIETGTLKTSFGSFAPRKQRKGKITFTYYPDIGNHFFGYYHKEGVWVASYSKKLLEEVARIQTSGRHYLLPEQDKIRHTFDINAPLNLMIAANCLNLYVPTSDTTQYRIENCWLGADLFSSKGKLCYFGSMPAPSPTDSICQALADSVSARITQACHQLRITTQVTTDNGKVYFTGCEK